MQLGFRMVFRDADREGGGLVGKGEFPMLMNGYFNSKHIKPTNKDFETYFNKLDLNSDGKISFEEYDNFVRMAYETEYLPALERELKRRGITLNANNVLVSPKSPTTRRNRS